MTVTLTPTASEPFTLDDDVNVIVAGYTGRDETQVRHHIAELAAIGVAPPPQIPMIYRMAPELLTTAGEVQVSADNSSGEVEPVLIRHAGAWYLGVGSDHTDRTLETVDIAESKQACPKPIGADVVAVRSWKSFDYDSCQASSSVDGAAYQRGSLAGLRRPDDLLTLLMEQSPELADGDLVVFGGTLPLIGGEFIAGTVWTLALQLPGGATLEHRYRVTVRSRP